jgi:integrase
MALKLKEPRAGKTPFYSVRGTYLGTYVERSTGAREREVANRILRRWKLEIERGEYIDPRAPRIQEDNETRAAKAPTVTFVEAAIAYMKAGGERKHLGPIIKHSGPSSLRYRPIDRIDQIAIDTAAAELFPNASPQTRNRQFYTPVAAVLHRAGVERRIKRPLGWKGSKSTSWLEPDQAFRLFSEADKIDAEFGLLLRFLTYTGVRLGEALKARLRDLHLEDSTLYVPNTKTGVPRPVYIPATLARALRTQGPRPARPKAAEGRKLPNGAAGRSRTDAGKPFLGRAPDAKLFRFHAGGPIRKLLADAMKETGLSFPRRQKGFHLFCHTYGTWMHHHGGLDTFGLVRTNRWKNPESADRYRHTRVSEEARRADLLPVEKKTP